MKRLFSYLSLLALTSLTLVSLSSCSNDDDNLQTETPPTKESPNIDVNFSAKIVTTPTELHNGDTLEISLTNIEGLDSLDKAEYKDKAEYSIEVEYFIDGQSVGSAKDRKNNFALSYVVKDLSFDQHKITATCKGGGKINLKQKILDCMFSVAAKAPDVVSTSLGTYFTLAKDLYEFVTPTITYTDSKGEHKYVITSDMCEETSFSDNGYQYVYYDHKWTAKVNLIPDEEYEMTLSFSPKDDVSINQDKKYFFDFSGFNIKSYSYTFNNTTNIGSIMDVHINISINVGQDEKYEEDGLLGGEFVDEYVKQLCASIQKIRITLTKDGHIVLGDKQY